MEHSEIIFKVNVSRFPQNCLSSCLRLCLALVFLAHGLFCPNANKEPYRCRCILSIDIDIEYCLKKVVSC